MKMIGHQTVSHKLKFVYHIAPPTRCNLVMGYSSKISFYITQKNFIILIINKDISTFYTSIVNMIERIFCIYFYCIFRWHVTIISYQVQPRKGSTGTCDNNRDVVV